MKQDGDFHPYENVQVFLFDIGTGDFLDFGGMVDDLSLFHLAFLLSKQHQELQAVIDVIERTENSEELRTKLLNHYDVFFTVEEETDFLLVTRDKEVAEAFLRSSS